MDPLELLKADLSEGNHEEVISSLKKLTIIASAMGPERTRNELIPFLSEYCQEDNDDFHDESITVVGAELGKFAPLVGANEHVHLLLPILESLACADETAVRSAAVTSIANLVKDLPSNHVLAKVYPVVKRLSNGEWYTLRVSACGIIGPCYQYVPEDVQAELRVLFGNLANDETPMVKKAAYLGVGPLVENMDPAHVKTDLFPFINELTQNDLDSNRVLAPQCLVQVTRQLEDESKVHLVVPLLNLLGDDKSWRVRKVLSELIPDFIESMGKEFSAEHVLPVYARLVSDPEPQVRLSAVYVLGKVAEFHHQDPALIAALSPHLGPLSVDSQERIKVSFSEAIVPLVGAFGNEAAQEHILPLCRALSRDEMPLVRNNVIEKVDLIAVAFGKDGAAQHVLPMLIESSKDPKWRVRMSAVGKCASIATHLGPEAFDKELKPLLVNALSDHVYSIRKNACAQVCLLVEAFGEEWAVEKMIPAAVAVFNTSTNYLHRMTSLDIVKNIVNRVKEETMEKQMLPIVISACTDEVANVRFAAAQVIEGIVPSLSEAAVREQVKPTLEKMATDEDVDVLYFSGQALKACNERFP